MSPLLFIAFSALLLHVSSAIEIPKELGDAFKSTHDLCMDEVKPDIEQLRKCKEKHIPDDPKSKCYLDCMIKHIRVTLEEKHMLIQDDSHHLKDDWQEMIAVSHGECGRADHNGDCDYAWNKINCFLKSHDGHQDICHLLMFT